MMPQSLSRGHFFGAALTAAAAFVAVAIPRPARPDTTPPPFAKYRCTVCDHVYDESQGDPDAGLAAGTRWADVPDDWACPDCGAAKADFVKMDS